MISKMIYLNASLVVILFVTLSSGFLVKQDADLLMYFKEVIVTVTPRESKATSEVVYYNSNTTTINYNVAKTGTDQMQIELDFLPIGTPSKAISSFKLNMTLTSARGYWIMSNLTSDINGTNVQQSNLVLLTQIPMEAPTGRSFHCSRFGKLGPSFAANLGNFTPSIEFLGLQAQAFNMSTMKFSESWDCVGFFSAGIWSGIFIVAILIGILTWGMCMIMDVKTMDRFDDPKGKAISFGGVE